MLCFSEFTEVREFQAMAQGGRTQTQTGRLPELKRPKQLVFIEQRTRENKAAHRQISGDLQKVSFEYSVENG